MCAFSVQNVKIQWYLHNNFDTMKGAYYVRQDVRQAGEQDMRRYQCKQKFTPTHDATYLPN
jgi:hypothetical protein